MSKAYVAGPFRRFVNRMMTSAVNRGKGPKEAYLPTVTGRKTGQPHTTPVSLVIADGVRWLVCPYGEVNWVRNVRAGGQVTLSRGRSSEAVSAVEIGSEDAAPVLKQYLTENRVAVGSWFDAKPGSPLPDFAAEAGRHPVFRLEPKA